MRKTRFLRGAVILSVCLLIFCAACLVSNADVIWTPNDDFYEYNYDDCVYEGRNYLANGSEGYVTIYESPRSTKIVDQFENGNSFYVSFTYTGSKGDRWGVVQFKRDGDQAVISYSNDSVTGWIPMEDLLVCYDHKSFCEDHEDEFEEYAGGFDAHGYEGKILFWTYPGSGVVKSSVDMKNWEGKQIDFSMTYTDENGREWGYVTYFFANRGWVCMSDPTNENLPAKKVSYEGLIPAAKPVKPGISGDMTLIICLVAGVAILTAVLIGVFFRRKKG